MYIYILDRLMPDLIAYIKGDTNQVPVNNIPLPNDVKDIYYLMADYNFKIKMSWVFYKLTCINEIIVNIFILCFRVKLFIIIYWIFVIILIALIHGQPWH